MSGLVIGDGLMDAAVLVGLGGEHMPVPALNQGTHAAHQIGYPFFHFLVARVFVRVILHRHPAISGTDLVVRRVGPAVGDVLADAPVEEQRLLRHVGDLPAERLLRAEADVLPVHDYLAVNCVDDSDYDIDCRDKRK